MEYALDQVDLQILKLMQENGRINNADIARHLGMAPSAVLERVKKLEQKEVILQYTARINPQALEQDMLAYIFIKAQDVIGDQKVGRQLAALPEVLEVHDIAGDDGYLIKVRTRDTQGLVGLMRKSLSKIKGIISTRTTIVLDTLKETTILNIP
ncbi:MAG: AsnC family transcriptional regulator [Bacteroidetes bacterium 47-18]|nr:MAG: AsnC family transcriptional regulator [Bacteroidetes bacterium 47-18]